jgi:predicted DCC family thiol-disulfide oxidoreductase YuxK
MAAHQPVSAAPGPLEGLPPRIVLFDGVCVFCNRSVDWLMRRDREGRLHFAPLQGETAQRVRAAFPEAVPEGIDTIVYLEQSGPEPRLWLRSQAVARILADVGDDRLARLLRLLPTFVADLGYRVFARIRYAVFGRREECRVPTPAERAHFLP